MICSYWAWFYTVWNGYYGKMLKVGDTVRNGIYGKIPFKNGPFSGTVSDGLGRSQTISGFGLDIARNGNYGLTLWVLFFVEKQNNLIL